MSDLMRTLIALCEATESRAARFIRETEKWVITTSKHKVEPPSMIEVGSTTVIMEPLSLGHPKVVDILLTYMSRLADLLKVTVIVETVQNEQIYSAKGFAVEDMKMVRRPISPQKQEPNPV